MDLFHAITQGLDNVLTCHWYDEIKNFTNMDSNSSNETKMMDTERGGEQTQYEGAVTENLPTAKATGQLGTGPHSSETDTSAKQERGAQTADNIRYGQNISESGVGGMTTTSSGHASQGGHGGVEADQDEAKPGQTRREQGYGPGNNVGA